MVITAADVKRLRDATGAGMMDAKKALEAADGDFDKAVEELRIKGAGKAAKRGMERTANNGMVAAAENGIIELVCETDFVAKNDEFQSLAGDIVACFGATAATDVTSLLAEKLPTGNTVSDSIQALAAVIGEKIELRRAAKLPGTIATYLHRKSADLPPQVGVLVSFEGTNVEVARGAAMQICALRAQYLSREDVPAELVDNERRIAEATAREEGKPEGALPKIVEGRINGFFKEIVLLDQASVHDHKRSVKAVLEDAGIKITGFVRFEVAAS